MTAGHPCLVVELSLGSPAAPCAPHNSVILLFSIQETTLMKPLHQPSQLLRSPPIHDALAVTGGACFAEQLRPA